MLTAEFGFEPKYPTSKAGVLPVGRLRIKTIEALLDPIKKLGGCSLLNDHLTRPEVDGFPLPP